MDRKKLKKEYARLVAESIKENIEPKDIEYINNAKIDFKHVFKRFFEFLLKS